MSRSLSRIPRAMDRRTHLPSPVHYYREQRGATLHSHTRTVRPSATTDLASKRMDFVLTPQSPGCRDPWGRNTRLKIWMKHVVHNKRDMEFWWATESAQTSAQLFTRAWAPRHRRRIKFAISDEDDEGDLVRSDETRTSESYRRSQPRVPVRGTPRRMGSASAACTRAHDLAKCLARSLSRASILRE